MVLGKTICGRQFYNNFSPENNKRWFLSDHQPADRRLKGGFETGRDSAMLATLPPPSQLSGPTPLLRPALQRPLHRHLYGPVTGRNGFLRGAARCASRSLEPVLPTPPRHTLFQMWRHRQPQRCSSGKCPDSGAGRKNLKSGSRPGSTMNQQRRMWKIIINQKRTTRKTSKYFLFPLLISLQLNSLS